MPVSQEIVPERFWHLRPSDLASFRRIAETPEGREKIKQALGDFLDTVNFSTVSDVDPVFFTGVQVRSIWPAGHALESPSFNEAAELAFLHGFNGLSFDAACTLIEKRFGLVLSEPVAFDEAETGTRAAAYAGGYGR